MTLLKAARLPFLVLTPLCIALGLGLLYLQNLKADLSSLALILMGATLVHVSVNGFNEYFDFRSGLDLMTQRTPFSGGSGALPAAPSAASAVLSMASACMAAAAIIGFMFVAQAGWPLLVICLLAAFIAVSYSPLLNRNPVLCYLAPGVGFGLLMVFGTLIALGGRLDATAVLVGSAAALWVNQLLLVNQLPDEQADRAVGRRHLVVLWGRSGAMEFSLWPLTLACLLVSLAAYLSSHLWLFLALVPAMGLLLVALAVIRRQQSEALMAVNLLLVLLSMASLAAGLFLSV